MTNPESLLRFGIHLCQVISYAYLYRLSFCPICFVFWAHKMQHSKLIQYFGDIELITVV